MNELVEALRAEERLAPDPADVLAGVAGGIRRRRRRRWAGRTVAVLAVVLLAGVAVVRSPWVGGRADDAPAGRTVVPTGDWNRTLRFGWLPEGMTPNLWEVSTTGEVASVVRDDARYLRVTLYSPGLQPRLDQPGWQRITVGGLPGRVVSRTARTLIKWQLPSGRWADLEYGHGQPNEAEVQPALQASAERIAGGITEGDPEPVRVAFALTHVPRGMRIVGVRTYPDRGGVIDVAPESRAAPRFETSTGEEAIVDDRLVVDGSRTLRVSVMSGDVSSTDVDTPIDDIQGRPAWSLGPDRGVTVAWDHGVLTVMPATWDAHPALNLAVFRAVAEGVRWTG
ncbi:hypothetical protein [Virgisporangium ochraceum]|uniref:hypothetical protein n=1 Tax=Virgisporangium ochraceum TaxID=65505 RepID=UPI0019455007|nr:hypothetical protein [Virgisporangium ochraceum]